MINKKLITLAVASMALLAGCGKLEKGTSHVDPSESDSGKVDTTGRIDRQSYQAVLVDGKYKPNAVRGLTASVLSSPYNASNLENGLVELSKDSYPVDNYLFQEGQILKREDIIAMLTQHSEEAPNGLNPGEGPIIFEQVLEQDFWDKKKERLAGISLGIALNSETKTDGETKNIDDETIVNEGKRIAQGVLERLRSYKGMEKIPVTIGLFKQAKASDIAGGDYFAKATSEKGDKLGEWSDISEEYLALIPGTEDDSIASKDGLVNKYGDFKNSVDDFFPNNSGMSAVACYRDDELQKLTIKIETKYFGETELFNFTQFVGKTAQSVFNLPAELEIQINTLEGTKGTITKALNSDEFNAHAFD